MKMRSDTWPDRVENSLQASIVTVHHSLSSSNSFRLILSTGKGSPETPTRQSPVWKSSSAKKVVAFPIISFT